MSDKALAALRREIDSCYVCPLGDFRREAGLRNLFGAGASRQPRVMFVGINPSTRNLTLQSSYSGPRVPFMSRGSLPFYTALADSGLLDKESLEAIKRVGDASKSAEAITSLLTKLGYYVVSLNRCPAPGNRLPTMAEVDACRHFLAKEVRLVDPGLICTLGLLPLKALAKVRIRSLSSAISEVLNSGKLIESREEFGPRGIFPCYLPTGRGLSVGYERIVNTLIELAKIAG